MRAPDVTVVVVSWRTRDLTLACLDSIARDASRADVSCEVVVVDNASGDGTVEAVSREHPEALVVENAENLGFAAACNRGVARASGRYVLLLNPDAEIAPGTLGRLAGHLDANPDVAVAGCRLVAPDGSAQFSCGRFLTPWNQFAETLKLGPPRRSYAAAEVAGDAADVDWVVGACLAVRRSAFDEIGGLDERFFMYSEDEDLCFRLRTKGWRVHYLPGVEVRHVGGGSVAHAIERMRSETRASQAAFVRKHRGRSAELAFRALMRLADLKPLRRRRQTGWER